MRSKFDIITEVVAGVKSKDHKNLEAIAKKIAKETSM